MSYLRGACGLNRMDSESNVSVYGKFGMSVKSEGMNCGVMEVVKRSTLRWFRHLERMWEDELTKRIYKSGKGYCGRERKTPYKMRGQSVGILEGQGGTGD